MKEIDRRGFLKVGGSLAVGAVIAGAAGTAVWKMFSDPGALFYGTKRRDGFGPEKADDAPDSPYRLKAGFETEADITALAAEGERLIVGMGERVEVFTLEGQRTASIDTGGEVRSLAVHGGEVFVLHAADIAVFGFDGTKRRQWQACDETADYCSITAWQAGVYASDAANKVVVRYTLEGNLKQFIRSPQGFVIPSYCFALAHRGDTLVVSNAGRHRVESYSAEGEFLGSFGKAGSGAGEFSGCCNPVRLLVTGTGEVITSEKGRPRVSCYTPEGDFRAVLLGGKMLGAGHAPSEVAIAGSRIVTAAARKIKLWERAPQSAPLSGCGACDKDCPLAVK